MLPASALSVRAEPGTVRPPSPESAVDSSREDSLSRESIVVRSPGTSGLAELAVDKPAEEPSTGPESVPELPSACDPSSAGAGSLGGGTESVLPLTAPEPQRRPAGLLLAQTCVVEKPVAASGSAPEVAPVSTAPVPPAASGAVPGATAVAVASVLVEVVSEGAGVHSAASGAVPGATVVAVASVLVEVVSEGAGVHSAASGAVPGATVVAVASVLVEVVLEGAGTSVLGSVAPIGVPSVSAESVSDPSAAFAEGGETSVLEPVAIGVPCVSAESVSDASAAFAGVPVPGAVTAALVVVPEASAASAVEAFASVPVPEVLPPSVAAPAAPGAAAVTGGAAAGGESVAAEAEDGAASIEVDGARSSARALLTKNDAQARAVSSAAVQPRTFSHRWSARTAIRFGTTALPSRWQQSRFEPRIITVGTWRASRGTDREKPKTRRWSWINL
jgi:hypothetical protein